MSTPEKAPNTPNTSNAPTSAELEEQERQLTLPRFTHEDAWTLGSRLVELARERNAPVAVDIRRGHQQVFHAALAGSSPENDAWIDRKRRVVEHYGHSSLLVGTRYREKGTTFEESSRLDAGTYAAHGGAFPVLVEGAGMIGTVVVSGLPQVEDHALVVEALEALRAELTGE